MSAITGRSDSSEANAPQVAPLLFEILKRVLEEYAVSFEEAVQRLASLKSKEAAQFRLGYPAITKLFKRKGLKSAPGQARGISGKTPRQIVRNLKSHSQLTELPQFKNTPQRTRVTNRSLRW